MFATLAGNSRFGKQNESAMALFASSGDAGATQVQSSLPSLDFFGNEAKAPLPKSQTPTDRGGGSKWVTWEKKTMSSKGGADEEEEEEEEEEENEEEEAVEEEEEEEEEDDDDDDDDDEERCDEASGAHIFSKSARKLAKRDTKAANSLVSVQTRYVCFRLLTCLQQLALLYLLN